MNSGKWIATQRLDNKQRQQQQQNSIFRSSTEWTGILDLAHILLSYTFSTHEQEQGVGYWVGGDAGQRLRAQRYSFYCVCV